MNAATSARRPAGRASSHDAVAARWFFSATYPEAFKANVHMPLAGHFGDVETEIGRVVVQLCGPDFKFMNSESATLEAGTGQRP